MGEEGWEESGDSNKKNIPIKNLSNQPTVRPPDQPRLQHVDALTEGEEDAVDVSFLQAEAAGHATVADALGQKREGQQDGVRQRQASTSRHPSSGFGVLKQVDDVLMDESEWDKKGDIISQPVDLTGIQGKIAPLKLELKLEMIHKSSSKIIKDDAKSI